MSATQTIPSTPQCPAGRIVIVTGGSRGIGAAVAHRLATDGTWVVVVHRSNAVEVDTVINRIRSIGVQATAVQADVGDAVSVDVVASTVRETFGAIDIFVNNAGILENQPVDSIDLASFDAQSHTNAFSTVLVTRIVLPYVLTCGGHIMNVSSSLVYQPRAGLATYAASRAAAGALTHAFAVEPGPRNTTVNAVAPALTRTDMAAPIPDEVKVHMRESTSMGHLAEPDDIADAITFLTSDDARWITGRILMTDGGFI